MTLHRTISCNICNNMIPTNEQDRILELNYTGTLSPANKGDGNIHLCRFCKTDLWNILKEENVSPLTQ